MLQDALGEKCRLRVPLCLDMHDLTASYQRWFALPFMWCEASEQILRHMLNQTQDLECKKVTSRKLCHAFYNTCFVTAWQTLPRTPKLHHHHHQKQHQSIDVKACFHNPERVAWEVWSTNVIINRCIWPPFRVSDTHEPQNTFLEDFDPKLS